MENVIIIGSGPAGMTAAIYAARADLKPLVAAGVTWGGLLMWTTEIENFPGFPEGVMGPTLMMNMKTQAEKFGAQFVMKDVTEVDFSGDIKKVKIGEEWHEAKTIIVSAGTKPRTLKLEGEKDLLGKGLAVCATCDAAFFKDKQVILVGGGDTAMEEANFLTKFAEKVYLIVRKDKAKASQIMIDRAENNPKIEIMYNTEVTKYIAEEKLTGVGIINNKTNKESEMKIDGLFFAIGHQPSTTIFKNHLPTDEEAYLEKSCINTMSNIDGVFIAGDIQDKMYRQAIVASGEGAKAGMDAIRWIEAQE